MVPGHTTTNHHSAIEIKGSFFSLLVLRIKSLHLEKVKTQLIQHFSKVADFFAHNPIILDFQFVRDQDSPYFNTEWLQSVLEILRSYKLVVVGVRNVNEIQRHIALMCQLGLLAETTNVTKEEVLQNQAATELAISQPVNATTGPAFLEPEFDAPDMEAYRPAPAPQSMTASRSPVRFKVINKPIRSGQRIYTPDSDLIILAAVSPGAEVIASGSIHVYAPLRGRALAGANGDRSARIFSYRMEAELVAIAGYYKLIEEDLPKRGQTRPTQVYLEGEKLIIEALTR